jgi:hypothetical protein
MELSTELIRELLDYDQYTGVFVWRERSREWFTSDRSWKTWNSRFAGRVAGTVNKNIHGYPVLQICVLGKLYKASRLAFLWMGLPLPEQVDHDDGDSLNQAWDNLLASNNTENHKNQSMYRNNTSGVTGVCWDKTNEKWRAQSRLDGKRYYLGLFDDLDDAAAVVSKFYSENGYTARHGQEFSAYQEANQ